MAEAEGKAKSVRTDKDSLLRSMAHDLRTPLTGLMSYLDDTYRTECGQRARAFAEANFSRKSLADKFVSFLEEVISLK